jgi:hypothetical protein
MSFTISCLPLIQFLGTEMLMFIPSSISFTCLVKKDEEALKHRQRDGTVKKL